VGQTLFEKVWAAHAVRTLRTGRTQIFVGLHFIHEVTSPQAFEMLRARGCGLACRARRLNAWQRGTILAGHHSRAIVCGVRGGSLLPARR
jgi:homoaconitase/3-isopropylmalate dehydratase large subunit